jgi:hypothetical protein
MRGARCRAGEGQGNRRIGGGDDRADPGLAGGKGGAVTAMPKPVAVSRLAAAPSFCGSLCSLRSHSNLHFSAPLLPVARAGDMDIVLGFAPEARQGLAQPGTGLEQLGGIDQFGVAAHAIFIAIFITWPGPGGAQAIRQCLGDAGQLFGEEIFGVILHAPEDTRAGQRVEKRRPVPAAKRRAALAKLFPRPVG